MNVAKGIVGRMSSLALRGTHAVATQALATSAAHNLLRAIIGAALALVLAGSQCGESGWDESFTANDVADSRRDAALDLPLQHVAWPHP
jgi:hypothetical protein